jgi:hypothetical protein
MVLIAPPGVGDTQLLGAVVVVAVVATVTALLVAAKKTHRVRVREMLTPAGDWWARVQAVTIATTLLPLALWARVILRLRGISVGLWWYLDRTAVVFESEKAQAERLRLEAKLRSGIGIGAAMVMVYLGENIPDGGSVVLQLALVGAMVWFGAVAVGAMQGRLQVRHPMKVSEVSDR